MLFFKKKPIPLNEFFPKGFVDIHSHLLPGIDDGAKDLNASIKLITKMSSYGIQNIITTPHVLGDLYPNSSSLIKQKLEDVKKELATRGITDIKVHAAAEYMIDEQFSELLKANDILTLKDNFILVEMSYLAAPFNLFEVLFEIQLKGYKPILAHPERYHFYHTDFEKYYQLKRAGCLFQLNLLSLTPHYGKNVQKISFKLLQEGLYDFVGTDTHRTDHLETLKKIGSLKIKKSIHHLLEHTTNTFRFFGE